MEKRNLNLKPREENTRDKFQTNVVRFSLEEILQHFTENVASIKAQFDVVEDLLRAQKVTEGETIWRSQVVLLASALDFYMHELTKFGLCQIYSEQWDKTEKYENIEVQIKYIEIALKSGEDSDWFLDFINSFYKDATMVSFSSVKNQLNLLGINIDTVADKAFYQPNETEKTKDKLKRRLSELFSRRNSIAHQWDREHTDAQMKIITRAVVEAFIGDVERIVQAIDNAAKIK